MKRLEAATSPAEALPSLVTLDEELTQKHFVRFATEERIPDRAVCLEEDGFVDARFQPLEHSTLELVDRRATISVTFVVEETSVHLGEGA